MPVRNANATWEGSLKEGKGTMALGSGRYEGPFTHASRFAEGDGTNPEELIGAAHAGCYSMFLSALLTGDGHIPTRIDTAAKVHVGAVDGAPTIHTIELTCEAVVPGIDDVTFQNYAAKAKAGCPVSKALASVGNIQLSATLNS